MDISTTTVPDSTQVNAEDLISGPRTVTITDVRPGTSEQPVNIDLAEFPGRAYRPSKTMRRILISAWGKDSQDYIGRRLTIYCDPDITFGRDKVGGIRISHLSHIDKPLTISLTVTRGRRAAFTVQPLPDMPPEIAEFQHRIADAATTSELDAIAKDLKARDLGTHKPHLLAAWTERRAAIEGTNA